MCTQTGATPSHWGPLGGAPVGQPRSLLPSITSRRTAPELSRGPCRLGVGSLWAPPVGPRPACQALTWAPGVRMGNPGVSSDVLTGVGPGLGEGGWFGMCRSRAWRPSVSHAGERRRVPGARLPRWRLLSGFGKNVLGGLRCHRLPRPCSCGPATESGRVASWGRPLPALVEVRVGSPQGARLLSTRRARRASCAGGGQWACSPEHANSLCA